MFDVMLQVITGADDSAITVWDVETGKKKLVFINAHGHSEIRCMALNTNGNILYTCAKNSGIKVNKHVNNVVITFFMLSVCDAPMHSVPIM